MQSINPCMFRPCMFRRLWTHRLTIPAVMLCLTAFLTGVAPLHAAVTGHIGTAAIEIDTNANLYPANAPFNPSGFVNGSIKNSGATADWAKDNLANTDTASLEYAPGWIL